MYSTIFVVLVVVWIVIWLLFRREFTRMGGRVPLMLGPFTIPSLLNEYAAFCEREGKPPIFYYLVYSMFGIIFAFVIGMIIFRR